MLNVYLRNEVGKFAHEMVLASLTFERVYSTMKNIIRTITTGFIKILSYNKTILVNW